MSRIVLVIFKKLFSYLRFWCSTTTVEELKKIVTNFSLRIMNQIHNKLNTKYNTHETEKFDVRKLTEVALSTRLLNQN
jgi:hypothetical protein